jgi:glycosyltransferase involved in cell wall biosynthesis
VKGLDVLIDAFALSLKQKKNAKLLIAGIPWKVGFDSFQQQITNNGIEEQCILRLNYHPNEIKPDYFAAADIVVLPYREIFASGVLVNALHYGAAIICSDLPFFMEYVQHERDCLMFSTENAASLAALLSRAYDNPEMLEKLRSKAQITANTTFDIKRIVRQTIDVYEQCISQV